MLANFFKEHSVSSVMQPGDAVIYGHMTCVKPGLTGKKVYLGVAHTTPPACVQSGTKPNCFQVVILHRVIC